MRILEFEVRKQRLLKKPGCDFSGLVAGSVGYLHAKFYFSMNEWGACTRKIARFWIDGQEHAEELKNDSCEIPSEVLVGDKFEVSVLGVGPNKYKIETNKVPVRQEVQ